MRIYYGTGSLLFYCISRCIASAAIDFRYSSINQKIAPAVAALDSNYLKSISLNAKAFVKVILSKVIDVLMTIAIFVHRQKIAKKIGKKPAYSPPC